MSKKIRTNRIEVKLSDKELSNLVFGCNRANQNKSEFIRTAIDDKVRHIKHPKARKILIDSSSIKQVVKDSIEEIFLETMQKTMKPITNKLDTMTQIYEDWKPIFKRTKITMKDIVDAGIAGINTKTGKYYLKKGDQLRKITKKL